MYLPTVFEKVQEYKSLSKAARQRLKWMDFYFSHGKNASLTIRHFGISSRTFYKWLNRYDPKDLKSLEDRSRKPKKVRCRTTPKEVEEKIIALRKVHMTWGKAKPKVLLERRGVKIGTTTIQRVINENKLFLPRGQRMLKKRRLNTKPRPPEELKKAFPGSLVQIDVKHLTTPWGKKYYQFSAVVTRMVFKKAFSTVSSKTAAKFLDDVQYYFDFPISCVQTDGGSEFKHHFEKALEKKKIPHTFSYPHCFKHKALVERTHRTHDDELCAVHEIPTELSELNRLLAKHVHTYNFVRPHQALSFDRFPVLF